MQCSVLLYTLRVNINLLFFYVELTYVLRFYV